MPNLSGSANVACLEQVYLVESDTGLLCRILGLYASRGLVILSASYAYAAQGVMRLDVRVPSLEPDIESAIRSLVAKAGTFLGVLAAESLEREDRRARAA